MKKVAVILAGSGVFDGSEIHETVFSLLAIQQNGAQYRCFAPNKVQYHVINHITGEEMNETRNVMVESARISRGEITPLNELNMEEFEVLLIPGGFGAAKNLNQWALKGPEGELDSQVNRVIKQASSLGKVICGLCMGPTVIAQALKESTIKPTLTVGSSKLKSPYDLAAINTGIASQGSEVQECSIKEVCIDFDNKIVTAPCYMMEGNIADVFNNVSEAIKASLKL